MSFLPRLKDKFTKAARKAVQITSGRIAREDLANLTMIVSSVFHDKDNNLLKRGEAILEKDGRWHMYFSSSPHTDHGTTFSRLWSYDAQSRLSVASLKEAAVILDHFEADHANLDKPALYNMNFLKPHITVVKKSLIEQEQQKPDTTPQTSPKP